MKVPQKMFRFRGAAGIDPTAARAAGFSNTDLIKQNFQTGKPGCFVVEYPGYSGLVLAPVYDVERKLSEKLGYVPGFGQRSTGFQEPFTDELIMDMKDIRKEAESPLKTDESALQARFQEMAELRAKNWGKGKIIEKIYGVKPGGTKAYKEAEAEYNQFLDQQ
jgi:hypothetical protein